VALDEKEELLELLDALEFEATELFEATCDEIAEAGGPFAAVRDAVNCCAVVSKAPGAGAAGAVWSDETLAAIAEVAAVLEVVFTSAFAWLALSEF
jgi:hypothetical protein